MESGLVRRGLRGRPRGGGFTQAGDFFRQHGGLLIQRFEPGAKLFAAGQGGIPLGRDRRRAFGGQQRIAARVAEAPEVEPELQPLQFFRDLFPVARLAGLDFERTDLPIDFFDDVAEAGEVLPHLFELEFRFALLQAETGDAGRFFEHATAFDRVAGDDRVDLPLLHEGVAAGDESGAEEEVAQILQADRPAIDEVLAVPRTEEPAGDDDFVFFDGKEAVFVVEVQRAFGHARRRPAVGAVEDDVRHLLAAQAGGALFAQDPFDGIEDVRLAATVRTDDARDPLVEREFGLVGKGLEPLHDELLEPHERAVFPDP